MKKLFIVSWLVLFLFAYKDYLFSVDAIWKIEQQRREHTYLFPFVAKIIHNKGFNFSYMIFENYLAYYSPFIFFYGLLFLLLRDNLKIAKIYIFWLIFYPILPALLLWKPTFLLQLPLIIPVLGYVLKLIP